MSSCEFMSLAAFRTDVLETSPPGTIALHGQLYPGPYPSDKDTHDLLASGDPLPPATLRSIGVFQEFLAGQKDRGIDMQRLRLLPPTLWPDVPAMAEMAEI